MTEATSLTPVEPTESELLVVTGMQQGTIYQFEAALVIGTLGFVATTAMAKFLMRGEVIE